MKGYINMQVLKPVQGDIKVSVEKAIEPKEFFKKRDGLYVYEDDRLEKLLDAAKSVTGNFAVESLELVVSSSDEQIEKSLENKNSFSESEACAIVAELISKQPKGEEGVLLTNGYANLFYTPACVVRVCWRGGGWHVRAWDRGDDEWGVGRRVFSPQLTLEN